MLRSCTYILGITSFCRKRLHVRIEIAHRILDLNFRKISQKKSQPQSQRVACVFEYCVWADGVIFAAPHAGWAEYSWDLLRIWAVCMFAYYWFSTPWTSTRVDARKHGAVSNETNIKVYSQHPTVPLLCLPCGNAALAASQARGHLHVAVACVAQSRQNEETQKHSLAHPRECPKCANRVHLFRKTGNPGVYPASH